MPEGSAAMGAASAVEGAVTSEYACEGGGVEEGGGSAGAAMQATSGRKASSSFSDLGEYEELYALNGDQVTPSATGRSSTTPTFCPIYEEDARIPVMLLGPRQEEINTLMIDESHNSTPGSARDSADHPDHEMNHTCDQSSAQSVASPHGTTNEADVLAMAVDPVDGEQVLQLVDHAAYIIFYKCDFESEDEDSGAPRLHDSNTAMKQLHDIDEAEEHVVKPPRSFSSLGAAGHKVQTTNCFARDYTHPTRSLGRGLFRASTSMGSAFLKGAAGLVNQTYQGGASGGVFGFAKGLGMGMLGLGTHTVKGAFRGVGQVTNVVGEMVMGSAPHFSIDGILILTGFRIVWMSLNTRDSFEIPLASIASIDTSTTAPHVLNIESKGLLRASFAFRDESTCSDFLSGIWTLYATSSYMFAHRHYQSLMQLPKGSDGSQAASENTSRSLYNAEEDYRRLKLLGEDSWMRIYENHAFELFPTYPEVFVIPSVLDEVDLQELAMYRSASRIPAVVWKHPHSGALVCRCAQPCAGLSGYVADADRKLVAEIQSATRGEEETAFHFFDARSQIAAAGNAAQGKGTEDPRNYPNTELHFCDIANIHAVRAAFVGLSALCQPGIDRFCEEWAFQLQNTLWFLHISRILASSQEICRYLCQGESVMIHCSDGWDRTPQLTSLVQLLLDPYYRTISGLMMLVEKEWCAFGHMFRWRYAQGDAPGQQEQDEQSPIFVQWLDAVWQIWRQQMWAFEFNEKLLSALYFHLYSGQFGNFMYNCERERKMREASSPTRSLWPHVMATKEKFCNIEYDDAKNFSSVGIVLPFSSQEEDLLLWDTHVAIANPVCRKYE